MMLLDALLFASLLPLSLAYSDTHPVLAWSSHSPNALSSVPKSAYTPVFLGGLLGDDRICDNDAVILVEQAGLHASDLRTLSRSSALVQSLVDAPSSLELPYMRRSTGHPFLDIASAIADRCASRSLWVSSGELAPHIEGDVDKKHVVCLGMPPVQGSAADRKQLMAEYERLLSSDLEQISAAFPKHLIVYAGWDDSLQARQTLEDEPSAMSDDSEGTTVSMKAAPSDGGILKRYQLLTPGLIISLAIAFFVLVPIVFMGISALASIQSPIRLDAPKGFNAAEKKSQ